MLFCPEKRFEQGDAVQIFLIL